MPHMDEIWLLDRGRLVDRAPHAELLKTSSLYRALWEKSERQVEEERLGTTPAAEASLL
jgi:ABC-type multidrug transport system fused ATPase/permease subunit